MVIISRPAREDLRQIFEYIARDSRHYAREVVLTIIGEIKTIEPFPLKGRVVPELQDETIREIFVYSFRIVYRIRDAIEIVAIIHGKRDLFGAMKDSIPEE